ncbi:MAG: arginase [Flavobacteriales bacterium]|nr:arginase [Flavobacteriales bacterium]NCA19629.1 arginase [Crocinitomicaceae bacterium]
MKDISIYFTPISIEGPWSEEQIGSKIKNYSTDFPEIEKKSCVLFSVPEFRGNKSINSATINSDFRTSFYNHYVGQNWNFNVVDLGEILPGNEIKDTYFAVANVVSELVKINAIPIVLGGSQDLIFSVYKGYENLEQLVNICSIDHCLDLGVTNEDINSNGYLSQILVHRPCYLFNHANIGLQIPYISPKELDLFEKLYFDICRLGEFNSDFKYAEPHLRNADIINIDFGSIKSSEVLTIKGIPNGFYAEQICQIAKYAGVADKVSSFGIFNLENLNDVSSKLLAQVIWYFIDGVAMRHGDFPIGSKSDYHKFTVFAEDAKHELIFYRSNKSERWWMEVPYPPVEGKKYERHYIVPCNKSDYENALKNEIPDIWWKTYHKLS